MAAQGDPVDGQATAVQLRAVEALEQMVADRPGGEVRPQQREMVERVASSFESRRHLIVQAGTGTGKSWGYLIPAITSGRRVVVSTATKQLSEQIAGRDLPFLVEHLVGPQGPVSFALLKGRENYLCKAQVAGLRALEAQAAEQGVVEDALFESGSYDSRRPSADDVARLNALLVWADETGDGDRSSAPACSDQVWREVSKSSTACVGASKCEFGDECFAEFARANAREADLVVTNHALVANDLVSPAPMFGEVDAIVFDEAHHVQEYLSSAWGLELTSTDVKHAFAEARRAIPRDERWDGVRDRIEQGVEAAGQLDGLLSPVAGESLSELPDVLATAVAGLRSRLADVSREMRQIASREKVASQEVRQKSAGQTLEALAAGLGDFLSSSVDVVRWVEPERKNRPPVIRTAPLWVGDRLLEALGKRSMVITSATVAVGGDFEQAARVFGLLPHPDDYEAVDVGTPFDYQRQAMLYIPAVGEFPAPVGADRAEHTEAVKSELVDLVSAAGGRTLALFTTRFAADRAAEFLRDRLSTPVIAQGDGPAAQLIEQFAADSSATLCATMGFWHGVDVPGESLSLVVIDKVPFAPMGDPLLKARMAAAESEGRSGFNDIYVADASMMIAQGFGRLIRSGTDRGVVAVLDTRIRSKGYGKTIVRTLPGVGVFADKSVVVGALERLAAAAGEGVAVAS